MVEVAHAPRVELCINLAYAFPYLSDLRWRQFELARPFFSGPLCVAHRVRLAQGFRNGKAKKLAEQRAHAVEAKLNRQRGLVAGMS